MPRRGVYVGVQRHHCFPRDRNSERRKQRLALCLVERRTVRRQRHSRRHRRRRRRDARQQPMLIAGECRNPGGRLRQAYRRRDHRDARRLEQAIGLLRFRSPA